ncbi:ribonuclease P protein component [Candidatus Babeliales bacterium]|nr:ribonuclease P protein component [Candidatus Babeliales bacterium]
MPRIKLSSFSRTEISDAFKRARLKVRYSGLKLLVAPSDRGHGKLLIVTPRRSGNSPQRNLFRRRMKALFRENNLSKHSITLIALVDRNGIELSFKKLEQLVLSCFE